MARQRSHIAYYCYVAGCTIAIPRIRPEVPWPGKWTWKARDDKRTYIGYTICYAGRSWKFGVLQTDVDVTDEDFWALISVLGGVADERSVTRLATRLNDRAEDFQQRVDNAVRDLDGARFQALPINDVSDPDDTDPIPLTGTALESFLLAVVAAGPEVYSAVRSDPTVATTRRWSFSEADQLGRVHEEITGPAGWCRPLVFGSSEHWLCYADAVLEIAAALDAREDWRSWWSTADRERLDLVIELTDQDTGTIRHSGRVVRADFRLPLKRLLHRPPGVAARIAAEDLTRILQLVARKLALAEPPALPWPAHAEPEDPRSADRAARLKELRRKLR